MENSTLNKMCGIRITHTCTHIRTHACTCTHAQGSENIVEEGTERWLESEVWRDHLKLERASSSHERATELQAAVVDYKSSGINSNTAG